MEITFTNVRKEEKGYYSKNLSEMATIREFNCSINKIDIKEIKNSEILCVFIYDKLTGDLLSQFPKLKMVITRSVGFDHIDINYCKKRHITVCHIPAYSPKSIAEHTFALILTLSKKLKVISNRENLLNFSLDPEIISDDLYTQKIGVVGTGKIGSEVAKIALSFGMKVFAYDISKNTQLEKQGAEYVKLNTLLSKSDIITLHVPYNESTHHLINRNNINLLKRNAILINTSRGKVVDTDAVYYALLNKKIGGLGLDVFEDEEILTQKKYEEGKSSDKVIKILRLKNMENVIITPHSAFYTKDAVRNIKKQTVECIRKFLQKEDISAFRVF